MKTFLPLTIPALCLLGIVAAPALAADVSEQKRHAYEAVERNAQQIATVGDALYYYAELGMQELESAKFLKETLEGIGFAVEVGGAGLPTNVWAKWGKGKPVIAIVTEIDALPEGSQTPGSIPRKPLVSGAPGHMEGHNTHGGVAVGAAYALKRTMERYNLPGTVVLSFGPAEEQLISRPFLVRAGYFKDVDAAVLIHLGDSLGTAVGLQNYAAISAKFTFHGRTAHGAVAPWEGKDALDAVELMSIGLDKLREHLRPTYRAHRTITMGGIQPNIIPDLAQIWWYVRDATGPWAKENYDKLVNIAKGAALMTDTTVDIEVVASAWPQLANRALAEAIQKNVDAVGMPSWSEEEVKFARDFQAAAGKPQIGLNTKVRPFGGRPQAFSSNDNGDVTWNVPSALLNFPSMVPGIASHNWQAGVTPTMSISHKGMVAGSKALAASVLDLMTSPDLLQKAREEFQRATKDTRYFSLLPPDAKPPLDMNREIMERYRPEMRKHYLNARPEFK
ncbi:MAG TPA: amidohydrolase [Burkholderiales bacterium]|nr:amidohydrolase [Burkholderiales bacterium]